MSVNQTKLDALIKKYTQRIKEVNDQLIVTKEKSSLYSLLYDQREYFTFFRKELYSLKEYSFEGAIKVDHTKFKTLNYQSDERFTDLLGVVLKRTIVSNTMGDSVEIGVIIQVHNAEEIKTDMWGNSVLTTEGYYEHSFYQERIEFATMEDIERFRPDILKK
jgi:hypothetical protein